MRLSIPIGRVAACKNQEVFGAILNLALRRRDDV
jgi:hypothetical protein